VLDDADGLEDGAQLRRAAEVGDLTVEQGHPADRLVELARDGAASFVVVGNQGPRSSLLGSISADVARRAPCPVVVVPPAATATAASGDGLPGGIVPFGRDREVRRIP
jgi:nucleotide-binding universal stress UspA family protein